MLDSVIFDLSEHDGQTTRYYVVLMYGPVPAIANLYSHSSYLYWQTRRFPLGDVATPVVTPKQL